MIGQLWFVWEQSLLNINEVQLVYCFCSHKLFFSKFSVSWLVLYRWLHIIDASKNKYKHPFHVSMYVSVSTCITMRHVGHKCFEFVLHLCIVCCLTDHHQDCSLWIMLLVISQIMRWYQPLTGISRISCFTDSGVSMTNSYILNTPLSGR